MAAKKNGSERLFKSAEVGLVGRVSKARQAEDKMRADAWKATREAELEAILNRSYTGHEVPGIPEILAEAERLIAPLIAEFDRLFAQAYPAQFARARLSIAVMPGGIHPDFREQVRKDATRHLQARHRYMLANSAGFHTETLATTAQRATDNPEVRDILEKLAQPNETTPTLEPPGPAIGVLAKLLPHPEEWGLAGYEKDQGSPLLPAPAPTGAKALPAPAPDDEE